MLAEILILKKYIEVTKLVMVIMQRVFLRLHDVRDPDFYLTDQVDTSLCVREVLNHRLISDQIRATLRHKYIKKTE